MGARLWDEVAWILGITVIGTVTFMAIGFMIGAVTKTPEAANAMGSAIGLPLILVSGAIIPRDELPTILATIGSKLPPAAVIDGMNGLIVDGKGPMASGQLPFMLFWAIVLLAAAARIFRFKD
jgi:ABC-2 type transport system permease protein